MGNLCALPSISLWTYNFSKNSLFFKKGDSRNSLCQLILLAWCEDFKHSLGATDWKLLHQPPSWTRNAPIPTTLIQDNEGCCWYASNIWGQDVNLLLTISFIRNYCARYWALATNQCATNHWALLISCLLLLDMLCCGCRPCPTHLRTDTSVSVLPGKQADQSVAGCCKTLDKWHDSFTQTK